MAIVEAAPDLAVAEPVDGHPPAAADGSVAIIGATLAACALGGVGSVLPWVGLGGAQAGVVRTYLDVQGQGLGGLDRNGALTVLAFVSAAGFAVARALGRQRRAASLVGIAAGLFAAAAALLDLDAGSRIEAVYAPSLGADAISSSVGIGLWLTAAAGLALAVVAAVGLVRDRRS